MKKFFFLMTICLACMACDGKEKAVTPPGGIDTFFSEHCVPGYMDGTWQLIGNWPERELRMRIADDGKRMSYFSMSDDVAEVAEFRRIAEHNGDAGYDREVPEAPFFHVCYAHNLKSIRVVSPDCGFGPDYPAGAPLDAAVTLHVRSLGAFVDSGYTKYYTYAGDDGEMLTDEVAWIEKRLPDLTATDLKMLVADETNVLSFTIDVMPDDATAKSCTLCVTLQTEEDREIAVEGTLVFR